MKMPTEKQLLKYLRTSFKTDGKKNTIEYFGPLSDYEKSGVDKPTEIKKLGYGVPYLIVYRLGGVKKKAILSTMRIGHGFGHDYRADRVDNLRFLRMTPGIVFPSTAPLTIWAPLIDRIHLCSLWGKQASSFLSGKW